MSFTFSGSSFFSFGSSLYLTLILNLILKILRIRDYHLSYCREILFEHEQFKKFFNEIEISIETPSVAPIRDNLEDVSIPS